MKKFARICTFALLLVLLFGCTAPAMAASFTTYTYSIDGFFTASPHAYRPEGQYDYTKMGITGDLSSPADLETDADGNVYIADSGNNRILVLDKYLKFKYEIKNFVNQNRVPDSFRTPKGVFIKDTPMEDGTVKRLIYVADTFNNRIVVFAANETNTGALFYQMVKEPKSDIMPEGSIYTPKAVAVDDSGRIYVVSENTNMGIIAMLEDGTFIAFVGAQKVSYSMWDIIWRRFQTEAQRAQSAVFVPTEYNNLTINDRGFIYVTTDSINENKQQAAITSKSGDYAPVKKFNSSGDDIMKRNGFFAPNGEVAVQSATSGAAVTGASKIVDVALGPEETWSILDQKRSRIFTYDSDGKLLFAFGDNGSLLGHLQQASAIVYQGSNLLALDTTSKTVTVYTREEYGDILIGAIHNNNMREYDRAVDDWKAILQRNSNFDAAYIGIGKALYRSGDWDGAMEYFAYAYDTENYSEAYKMWRKDWVSENIIWIPVVIIAIVLVLKFFLGYAKKVNAKVAVTRGKRTFGQEILFGFHLIFHPFDGYWDLKHEKRGSVRGATFYLFLATVAFTYNAIGKGYIHAPRIAPSVLGQMISVLAPVLLWILANWCLTTLFEGEGSFKDIYIATCYSLLPIALLFIPATLLTHILTASEASIISLVTSIAWIWAILLIFFGMQVTHDYSSGKNILTTAGTIVGMAFIIFIGLLFSTLLTKMVSFVSGIISEISYRM